jgi:hypothetical protein
MRRRHLVLGLAAAVAVGAAIVVASLMLGTRTDDKTSARAAPTPHEILTEGLTVGVQDDHLAVAPLDELEWRMGLVRQTGARITRVDVLWNEVAPTRPRHPEDPGDPAYRWRRYDAIASGLARRGIAPIFSVYRSPSWANGGRSHEWAPDPDDYAAFMSALAKRYDGRRGGRVAMFEPWNEPNLAFFLRPQWAGEPGAHHPVSPAIYADLLTRAYAAIKAAQPDALVLGVSGGSTGGSKAPDGAVGIMPFLRELARLRPPMDAFAQHLYPAGGPGETAAIPSYVSLPQVLGALDEIKPGAPLFITEFGWTTAATPYRKTQVSEAQQAAYLPQAIALLQANPRVRAAIWFNLQDNPGWPAGLLREDGTQKPAWGALALGLRAPGAARG